MLSKGEGILDDYFNIDTNTGTGTGTTGGTREAIFLNILQSDIIRTIGFAALGGHGILFRQPGLEMAHKEVEEA